MTEPLTRSGFAAWLAALPADAPAGSCISCPLRVYLRQRHPGGAWVGSLTYWTSAPGFGDDVQALPPWAREFARWVDKVAGRRWEDLTAGACRAALLEIEP